MDQNPPKEAVAVGKIPSGLFIVTSVFEGNREGYLASWIQQTSFSPLLVSLAVKPGRPCYAAMKAHGRFCVNVVGHQNGGMMKPFWNVGNQDPFAGLEFDVSPRGNIVLRKAVVALECEFRSSANPGDHEIVFAEVVESHLLQVEDKPLTHTRKSGLGY
jgi:flavin reductase (DIM6/NTAB) family NADH-FMN oxidoreductase RutF